MDGETTSKEKLAGDLRNLVADAEELLKATASQAGEKIGVARQKIEQSLIEGKKALADAEKNLVKNPKSAPRSRMITCARIRGAQSASPPASAWCSGF